MHLSLNDLLKPIQNIAYVKNLDTDENILVNVDELDPNLPRHLHPNFCCPIDGCGKALIPRFDRVGVKRSHFAHVVKENGIANPHSNESIIHFNIKHHLAKILKAGAKFRINHYCKSGFCKGYKLPSLLGVKPDGYKIDCEFIINGQTGEKFLPDISFLLNGKTIGAIEICYKHLSREEKINFYRANNIAFIELKVDENNYFDIMNLTGSDEINMGRMILRRSEPKQRPPDICNHCYPEFERRKKQKEEEDAVRKEQEKRQKWIIQERERIEKLALEVWRKIKTKKELEIRNYCQNCFVASEKYFIRMSNEKIKRLRYKIMLDESFKDSPFYIEYKINGKDKIMSFYGFSKFTFDLNKYQNINNYYFSHIDKVGDYFLSTKKYVCDECRCQNEKKVDVSDNYRIEKKILAINAANLIMKEIRFNKKISLSDKCRKCDQYIKHELDFQENFKKISYRLIYNYRDRVFDIKFIQESNTLFYVILNDRILSEEYFKTFIFMGLENGFEMKVKRDIFDDPYICDKCKMNI